MTRKFISIIGGILLATTFAAQNGKKVWNFDTEKTGVIEGFTNEVGEWKIVADTTAPSTPNVLAQLAKNPRAMFNVTLISDTHYKDVDISVQMKAIAGNIDQGGGVVWRAKDAQTYFDDVTVRGE